jgi:hypothetical protein
MAKSKNLLFIAHDNHGTGNPMLEFSEDQNLSSPQWRENKHSSYTGEL